MWRLRRSSSNEMLRLGRVAAERWTDGPDGLTLVASQPLGAASLAQLPSVIKALFSAASAERAAVVLESAWVPLILAETGDAVWRQAEVEALLRHRLSLLHDDPADPVGEWDVRVDRSADDARALGYGFSPLLRDALREAGDAVGCEWRSLLPAWVWGWQRFQPQRQWRASTGHWAWQEQDRTLLGSFDGGRLVAFNAACAPHDGHDALAKAVATHGVRHGLQASTWPVTSSGWGGDV